MSEGRKKKERKCAGYHHSHSELTHSLTHSHSQLAHSAHSHSHSQLTESGSADGDDIVEGFYSLASSTLCDNVEGFYIPNRHRRRVYIDILCGYVGVQ